ncbi:MAG: replicative DNA helicase [Desulfobacteraceae bacterium]|nr:replicative DNA helicase [Desulfobacteraceae bacterium]
MPDQLRQLPQDLGAEMTTIGSMMLAPDMIIDISFLQSEYFFRQDHRVIFESILRLHKAGSAIDLVILQDEMESAGTLKQAGGMGYVVELVNSVPSPANIVFYAGIVRDKHILRNLITMCGKFIGDAYDATADGLGIVADISTAMTNMLEQHTISKSMITAGEIAPIVKDRIIERFKNQHKMGSGVNGLPTGLRDVDEKIYGLERGEIIILAGRPSTGKSSMAINVAENLVLRESASVVVFSLEMSGESLVERLLSGVSGVNSGLMKTGYITQEGINKVEHAVSCVQSGATLVIDDTPRVTPELLRSLGRKYVNKYNAKLLIVDYLQLMSSREKYNTDNQKYADISRQMKLLARELNIPIIVLAQLNRAPEVANRRPRLSDLRDSGAIEQDADKVIMLWNDPEDPANIISTIIMKHRNGPTGTVKLLFHGETMKFQNYMNGDDYERQPDWQSNSFSNTVGN